VRYLVRTLVRNLRVGANWRSALSALGRAAVLHSALTHDRGGGADTPSSHPASGARPAEAEPAAGTGAAATAPFKPGDRSKEALDCGAALTVDAFHRCPNLARVISAIQAHGVWTLEATCGVATGVPLHSMLAKITEGFEDCVAQLTGTAALAEFKYDGQRAQVHVNEAGEVQGDPHLSRAL
jgi:DNA ligase 1